MPHAGNALPVWSRIMSYAKLPKQVCPVDGVYPRLLLLALAALLLAAAAAVVGVGALVLRGLVGVRLFVIEIREDEIEDLTVPARRPSFDALFDVLEQRQSLLSIRKRLG